MQSVLFCAALFFSGNLVSDNVVKLCHAISAVILAEVVLKGHQHYADMVDEAKWKEKEEEEAKREKINKLIQKLDAEDRRELNERNNARRAVEQKVLRLFKNLHFYDWQY